MMKGVSNLPLLKADSGSTPAKADPGKGQGPSGTFMVVAYIIGSVFSSVLIVLCNKEVFQLGFPFPLTVSCIAYGFTWLYYKVLAASGAWTKQKDLPAIENIKVALSSISSISFMNL